MGFANQNGIGLILAIPPGQNYVPYWHQCYPSSAGYISPVAFFDIPPGAVREVTLYLIPGPIERGREYVYALISH